MRTVQRVSASILNWFSSVWKNRLPSASTTPIFPNIGIVIWYGRKVSVACGMSRRKVLRLNRRGFK